MMTNATLTIYNRKTDPSTRKDAYLRTVLPAVWYHTAQQTNVGSNGLVSADSTSIRVPLESFPNGYLPAAEYKALALADAAAHWTVENGDLFCVGVGPDKVTKVSDLAGYKYGKVMSYSENFHGSNYHIRIGGA